MERYAMISFASFKRYCSIKVVTYYEAVRSKEEKRKIIRCNYFEMWGKCCARNCKIWNKMQIADHPACKKALRFSLLQEHCNKKFKSIKSWRPKFKNKIICGIASKFDFPNHEFDCMKKNCPRWHQLTEIIGR